MPTVVNRKLVTIEDVRAAEPEKIFYGARTCWWTHKPEHLGSKNGLPCDPRGGVLFETDDIEGFLKKAEENPSHYGSQGIKAFEAAHHENCVLTDGRNTCFAEWEPYNALAEFGEVTV